jgi:hypothetical protein
MKLIPVRYIVVGHRFKRFLAWIEYRGSGWTCVTDSNEVLNKSGKFEYEPSPSNRTEEFIARTRFPTAKSALKNFERHAAKFTDR